MSDVTLVMETSSLRETVNTKKVHDRKSFVTQQKEWNFGKEQNKTSNKENFGCFENLEEKILFF